MSAQEPIPLVTVDGVHGLAESLDQGRYRVRLDDGTQLVVAADALTCLEDHSLYLPLGRNERQAGSASAGDTAEQVVPLAAEQLHVERQQVETGKTIVRKVVYEQEQVIDQPLVEDVIEVERVPVDQFVDVAPPSRQEGDTLVIPLVEEVLVVEKRLRVREEVLITRHQRRIEKPQRVTLRSEDVEVEQKPIGSEAPDAAR